MNARYHPYDSSSVNNLDFKLQQSLLPVNESSTQMIQEIPKPVKAKLTHKDAERRRRDLLSNAFKKIQVLVPNLVPQKGKDPNRIEILESTSLYIEQLIESHRQKDIEIQRLKDLLLQHQQNI